MGHREGSPIFIKEKQIIRIESKDCFHCLIFLNRCDSISLMYEGTGCFLVQKKHNNGADL